MNDLVWASPEIDGTYHVCRLVEGGCESLCGRRFRGGVIDKKLKPDLAIARSPNDCDSCIDRFNTAIYCRGAK